LSLHYNWELIIQQLLAIYIKTMKKIQKNECYMNYPNAQLAIDTTSTFCCLLSKKRKVFLWRIVTGDEK